MGSQIRASDELREVIATYTIAKYVFDNDIEIVTDKKRQTSGIDAVKDGKNIDFKFQVGDKYVGNPTPTFSLELMCKNRFGNPMTGWFLDKTKKTDIYGLEWTIAGRTKPQFQITEFEYMEVDVAKLKAAIFADYSEEELMDMARKMWGSNSSIALFPEYSISSSGNLFEQPINLVVRKSYLEKFATRHKFVKVPQEV